MIMGLVNWDISTLIGVMSTCNLSKSPDPFSRVWAFGLRGVGLTV